MNSTHFKEREFRCKDGCGINAHRRELLEHLEKLRMIIDKPIPIISGYRCPPHNARVKGAARSRHTTGEAADIPRGLARVQDAKAAGFKGIGVKDGWVTHVDVRRVGSAVVWQY